MSGKHKHWHRAWSRFSEDAALHASGLVVRVDSGGDAQVVPDSVPGFEAHEAARGVPAHDLAQRRERLTREAVAWLTDPRNRR